MGSLLLGGCHTAPHTAPTALLDPLIPAERRLPSQLDRAVANLAAAALASNRDAMERELSEIERLHTRAARKRAREEGQPEMKGLLPLCLDLANSTLEDPMQYRRESKRLLRRRDLDPALKARLKQAVADDALRLAFKRNLDTWESLWAQTFNAVSEPLGRSLLTGTMAAPLMLASSGAHYLAQLYERPAISVQDRQALALRKRFLARHPDDPEAPEVTAKVLRAEEKLSEMHVERHLRLAHRALDGGRPRLAALQAKRALLYRPHSDGGLRVLAEAEARIHAIWELRQRSLGARAEPPPELAAPDTPPNSPASGDARAVARPPAPESARQLAELLLASGTGRARLQALARSLRTADPSGPLADEAEFVLALVEREATGWRRLQELAARGPSTSNMARHARALVGDPWQHPYGDFLQARDSARRQRIAYGLLGPFAEGPRYHNMPKAIAYLTDAPAMAQTLLVSPVRLLVSAAKPPRDYRRPAAIAGYRYLGRYPEGAHAPEVMRWLFDYEKQRQNWAAALRLADYQLDLDTAERAELVERSARQALAAADRVSRLDLRGAILAQVVREFPDSEAAREAGARVRSQVADATPQRIRMTRGFLEENPRIAGPSGLGLSRALLDGDVRNGELHEEGVTFLDGHLLEFALVDGGDGPPARIRRRASAERVARTVAILDETARVNSQLDADEQFDADPGRDVFFERVRLGLGEEPDPRASARSTYVYRSMRERYGMVRARDSMLPFDVVVQGSFYDFSLGAFPRWRQPRQTPDAFLYR